MQVLELCLALRYRSSIRPVRTAGGEVTVYLEGELLDSIPVIPGENRISTFSAIMHIWDSTTSPMAVVGLPLSTPHSMSDTFSSLAQPYAEHAKCVLKRIRVDTGKCMSGPPKRLLRSMQKTHLYKPVCVNRSFV